MKKKVFVVVGAASYNRGSEALIRGLAQICRQTDVEYFVVSTADYSKNITLKIDGIDEYIPRYIGLCKSKILKKAVSMARSKFGLTDLTTRIISGSLLRRVNNFDIIIIIGADNLDRKVNYKRELYSLTELIKKKSNAKLILYDCSIDIANIDDQLIAFLDLFDVITARDKTSFENLRSKYKKENLLYYPDPAFIIGTEATNIEYCSSTNTVGINISDLISGMKNSKKYERILNAYFNVIDYVISETEMSVLLIPHVMNNADLSVLREIYKRYSDNERVKLIENENLNAMQLKYVISKCRFFIGARTHATIAAYSSYVPTLVLGYSIKSVGIAKDLFGTSENYVISSSEIHTEYELLNKFKWLVENEERIKSNLKAVMPEYIEKARKAADILNFNNGYVG